VKTDVLVLTYSAVTALRDVVRKAVTKIERKIVAFATYHFQCVLVFCSVQRNDIKYNVLRSDYYGYAVI